MNNSTTNKQIDQPFDLNYQYDLYLHRVNLNELQMSDVQKAETKRAFMGGCGQILDLLTDGAGELTESQAAPLLESLFEQVIAFWGNEIFEHGSNNGLVKP